MAYRRNYRRASASPRTITVRYAGKCACCGARIGAGEVATYYPPAAGESKGRLEHMATAWDEGERVSLRCAAELRKRYEDRAVNDYAGDGLDMRIEDQWRDDCGL